VRRLDSKGLYRVIDANINRSKEALRILEDVTRFFFDDAALTKQYKNIRHGLTASLRLLKMKELIAARDVGSDVGRASSVTEMKRRDVQDIFWANSQRLKESLRVLEEFSKLVSVKSAEDIKKLRYKTYVLEKKAAQQL
jgi:thiamine-phosphate pyrophosphorylase